MTNRRGIVALACASALVMPLPAQADGQPVASAASSAVGMELASARDRLAAAQSASNAAEARRRNDEEDLADAVVARLVAAVELREARHALAIARIERVRAAQILEVEERKLAVQAVETYRFGGPMSQAMMGWRVLEEASSPFEAARATTELGNVIDYQSDIVTNRRREWRAAVRAELRALGAYEQAFNVLDESQRQESDAIVAVNWERARAVRAERNLLAAIGQLFAAEDELITGGASPADVVAASGLWLSILPALEDETSGTSGFRAAEAAEPVALGERREWLENRQGALQRDVSLANADRAIDESWTCPLAYGSFSNDWHFPRSHGRRHKGLDMMSTEGTPIRAIHAGFVVTRDDVDTFRGEHDLGGVTVTIATRPERPWRVDQDLLPPAAAPTYEWYYAHMSAIVDRIAEDAWVEAGEVIGWVGDTGNARSTEPHLHLGYQVGNRDVNPYPSIAVACDPRRPLD